LAVAGKTVWKEENMDGRGSCRASSVLWHPYAHLGLQSFANFVAFRIAKFSAIGRKTLSALQPCNKQG